MARGHLYVELLAAPHERPRRLPEGFAAVYAFAVSAKAGRPHHAGPVRSESRPRRSLDNQGFRSSHYQANGPRSTLARSLVSYPIIWPWLGIDHLDHDTVMLASLNRIHVFVPDVATRQWWPR